MSEQSCNSCNQDQCPSAAENEDKMEKRLSRIKHKIVVLSGKGGVGKSSVAVNLAVTLAQNGRQVGLLDVDVHGPSVPRLLSLSGAKPHMEPNYMEPVPWSKNLWVMSLGFLIPNREEAVIWRGPVKMGLIKQFLEDVAWGDLDYLIVDCPPGTGDEPLTTLQYLGQYALALIVTTPQGVAVDDVRRSITFVRQLNNPILGVVENMGGFVCPSCKDTIHIFDSGGGERLAAEMNVPFLGRIPMDPEMVRSGEEGYVYAKTHEDTPTAKALEKIAAPVLQLTKNPTDKPEADIQDLLERSPKDTSGETIIAIPVSSGGSLCSHFEQCREFALVYLNKHSKAMGRKEMLTFPDEPDTLPQWLAEQGIHLLIAGDVPSRDRKLLEKENIDVISGVREGSPEELVNKYLYDLLETGETR